MSWILVAALAGLALALPIVQGYRRKWPWVGVAATSTEKADGKDVQPAKTLWDWLQLLVIPLALAGLAFLLNTSQSNREQRSENHRAAQQRKIARGAAREETLRGYLTQMSDLILDRNLLRSSENSNVQAVARTITLTALRRIDGERRGLVIRFLYEARLIRGDYPKVALSDADLGSANLQGVDLRFANFSEADLRGADFRGAGLRGALFYSADLRGADLRVARLHHAVFYGAHLRGADLRKARIQQASFALAKLGGADLRGVSARSTNFFLAKLGGADLRRASLFEANVQGASFRGAKLARTTLSGAEYDANTTWPRGLDPVAAGAKEVETAAP